MPNVQMLSNQFMCGDIQRNGTIQRFVGGVDYINVSPYFQSLIYPHSIARHPLSFNQPVHYDCVIES